MAHTALGTSPGDILTSANVEKLLASNASGLFGIGITVPTALLTLQGTGTYNSTGGAIATDMEIRSSEMTDSAYHSILQLCSIRQSLTTGSAANGYLGFTTIDDSNSSGVDDAGRIAIVNEDGTQNTSATALSFWTNLGTTRTTAAVEHMRVTSDGKLGIENTSPAKQFTVGGVGSQGSVTIDTTGVAHPEIELSPYGGGGATVHIDADGDTFFNAAAGNVGVGVTAFGTSATGVLGLSADKVVPSTSPAGMIQIFADDSSGGAANATLAIRTEETVTSEVLACDSTLNIWVNGTEYHLLMRAV